MKYTKAKYDYMKSMTVLYEKYLKGDDFEIMWAKYIKSCIDDGKNIPPVNNFSGERALDLLLEVKVLMDKYEKDLFEFIAVRKIYLKAIADNADMELIQVPEIVIPKVTSRKQRRKKKVKSIPWSTLDCPYNEFIEIITNQGKKIAKNNDGVWIDEEGNKLNCKILKWRRNKL